MSDVRDVREQIDGWPVGVSDEEKAKITEAVRAYMTEMQPHMPEGRTLSALYDGFRFKHPNVIPGALMDWRFAVFTRALRAVGMVQVWRMAKPGE